ncbi:glycosyltransferase family 4 protein [Acaryochloris marina]|nr:glycosyltransferase family 4 protein [Acaryochloris marina]
MKYHSANMNNIPENIRAHCQPDELILMYIGNLELYQGIDLLLDGFKSAQNLALKVALKLVIIGGKDGDIAKYKLKTKNIGIDHQVLFLGQRSVENLGHYLAQADILLSPRIKGRNTPMKLYSYLDSGKPVLATDLPTHNWVLDKEVAVLSAPNPEAFAQGILYLANNPQVRQTLAVAAKHMVQKRHSFTAYKQKLNSLYDSLQLEFNNAASPR